MYRKTAFLLILLLACSSELAAQAGRGFPNQNGQSELRGKLVFATPRPPEDRIEVFLEKNMQRVQSAFTDSVGNFEFRAISPGDYQIIVRLPDYEEVNQQVTVYAQQRTTTISIQMNPLFAVVRRRTGFEGDDNDVVDVKTMLSTYPKKAVQEYEKALDENRKGSTSKAILHFEQAIQLAPEFYHAYNNLGVAYAKIQRYADAERAYRRAGKINPKAHQPLLNLGVLFITESDEHREEGRQVYGKYLDDAMDCLDEAIKLKPQSAMAHYFLGTAYYKSDFFEEAEESLKKAHDLDPSFSKTRIMLVNVYTRQKKLKEALEQIDAFLKENPKAEERPAMEDLRRKIVKALETSPQ